MPSPLSKHAPFAFLQDRHPHGHYQLCGMAKLGTQLSRRGPLVPLLLLTVILQFAIILQYIMRTPANLAPTLSPRSSASSTLPSIPPYCPALIRQPIPFRPQCNWSSTTHVCADGTPVMFSQFAQDWYVYHHHFRHLAGPGVYADIAAHEPVYISNTYFFDACLQWRGLCVEGNPEFLPALFAQRSCALVPTCVSDYPGSNVEFALNGGYSGVYDTNKNKPRWQKLGDVVRTIKLNCTTTQFAMDRAGILDIDYLSLDVEGHEIQVLKGIDWNRVHVRVITVEISQEAFDDIHAFLTERGFVRHMVKFDLGTYRHRNLLYDDAIYHHESVTWGRPA